MEQNLYNYIPNTDIYLFNTGNAEKAWLCYGCNYIDEIKMHRFIVWAPNAKRVSLVGDFNGWNCDANIMELCEGGVWVAFISNLKDGDFYKYCVDGLDGKRVLKTDPFGSYNQCGESTASIVCCSSDYSWNDEKYMHERQTKSFMTQPMSIYEIHAGGWKFFDLDKPIYRNLADSLSEYCSNMGYTHVELMPITEYPFDGSWGYQVSGYYAPTSRYGNPDDFKYFVDKMHEANIGVIMDWVPAHFPKDEHGLANFDGSPLFECKEKRMAEHPEWGTLIFDYSSTQVQSFLVSSACKFFDVYHIDGIRVDAVSSMLYLDYGRKEGQFTRNSEGGNINLHAVNFLRKLNKAILSNYRGTVTIAEESTAYPLISSPPEDGGLGFCLKWDMGFMHDTLDYMQMNPYFRSNNHDKLTFSMMYAFAENYVLAYSHDEVVHGKKSMIDKMYGNYDEKFASIKVLYGYQFTHPGKKLTFMGSEFGQFIEFDEKKELDWLLLEYPKHLSLQKFSADLNKIYTKYPALFEADKSWDGFKWLNVNDNSRSSIAFMRIAPVSQEYIVCVCNFTPVQYDDFIIGLPNNGTLTQILNSDDLKYGGNGVPTEQFIESSNDSFVDFKYSASVTLPPLSVQLLEFHPRENDIC